MKLGDSLLSAVTVSLHYLPQMSAFNSHMQQNTCCSNLKWTSVAVVWLCNKGQFYNYRLPSFATSLCRQCSGFSKPQPHHCMIPEQWTRRLLCSVSVISANKPSVQELSQLSCWLQVFYNFLFLAPISREWQIPIFPLRTPMNTVVMPNTKTAHQLQLLLLIIKW